MVQWTNGWYSGLMVHTYSPYSQFSSHDRTNGRAAGTVITHNYFLLHHNYNIIIHHYYKIVHGHDNVVTTL